MRFHFNEDQLLFQNTVRDFLANECTPEHIRSVWESETGHSPKLWLMLAELGVAGLLVPEKYEGMGLTEIEFVLLQEEAGRAALPEPVTSTAAVAAPLLVELGSEALCDRWLKPIAQGEAIAVVGHATSPFVSDAHIADLLLLQNGDEIHAVTPEQVTLTRQPAHDPSRCLFSVDWKPDKATRVAEGEKGRTCMAAALDRGALACAAQQLGVTDRLITMACDYAEQRHQFGKPIGSFQAVQHMLANLKVKLEYARPVVHRAAHSVAHAVSGRATHVSMAKVTASEAATSAAKTALQVHGAIGYTWEQDLHIWMKRAWSLERAWGGSAFHRRRVADAILAEGARLGAGATFAGD